jgi:hypothetical protein
MAASSGPSFPGLPRDQEKFAKLAFEAFMEVYGEGEASDSSAKGEKDKPKKDDQAVEPCKGKSFKLALGFDKGGSLKNFADRFNAVWFTKIQQELKEPLALGDLDKFQKNELKNYCDVVEGYLFSAMKYACSTGKGVFMNLHGNDKPDSVFKDMNRAKGALINYDKGIHSLRDWVANDLNWTAWEVAVIMNDKDLRKCTKFYYSPPGVLTDLEKQVMPKLKQVGQADILKKLKSPDAVYTYWEDLLNRKLDTEEYAYTDFEKDWPEVVQKAWDSIKDPSVLTYEELGTQLGQKIGELLMAKMPEGALTKVRAEAYPGKLSGALANLRKHDTGLLMDAQVAAFIEMPPPK